jgi:hypothetical protein
VQDAADQRGGGVQEAQMGFEDGQVGRAVGRRGPEDVVVVRELDEEDAEEETCCWERAWVSWEGMGLGTGEKTDGR